MKKFSDMLFIPLGAVLAGVIFRFLISHHVSYTCPFYAFTKIYCPGCGGTRALLALLEGHIFLALHENPAVILLSLLAVLWYLEQISKAIGRHRNFIPRHEIFWIILIIFWIIWDVLRNFIPELMPVT